VGFLDFKGMQYALRKYLDGLTEKKYGNYQWPSNVIDYITITLQFSWLHYITITAIFKCNRLNYNHFVNVIDYTTDYIIQMVWNLVTVIVR
jgi:hypothetical protein